MSPVVVLPNTRPVWDWIVQGNFPEALATQGDILRWGRGNLGLRERLQGQAVPKPITTHEQGGAGVVEAIQEYRGDFATLASRTTGATIVHAFGGINCMPVTDITGLAAGWINPSWRRVFWMTMTLAQEAGTLNEDTGMLLIPFGAVQVGDVWPKTAIVNQGGFGITCNGAGAWQWSSFGLGAFPGNRIEPAVPLVVADPEDWNQFDLVIVSGAPGREASLELLVNGVSTLTRDWVTAPALVDYAATEFSYRPVWRQGTLTGEDFFRGQYTIRNGRFLPSGQELLV